MADTTSTRTQKAARAVAPARAHALASKAPQQSASVMPAFTSDDIAQAFALSKGSTSIELKLTVPAGMHGATIKSLKLDPVEAQPRQTYFFDTPSLDLYKAGVVVRARRIQGGGGDTVIKLRPVDPANIDPDLKRSASFKIELDMMPGGYVCSASFKGICSAQEVLDVTEGQMALRSLFSKGQRAFFDKHAPAEIGMDSLTTLGPVFLLRSKHQPKDFNRRVTTELWLYPDGSRILEISTKCLPPEAFQAVTEFKAYLARCGIPLDGAQEPKTKGALDFFAANLD